MQRKFAFVFINSSFCTLFCTLAAALLLSAQAQAAAPKKEMVVVIDPGHGGVQPGAPGRFSVEKDIVLKVSKKVGEVLVKSHPDIEIVYTRTRDTSMDLADRGSLANKLSADLFISIHADADPKKVAHGTTTLVMGLDHTELNMEVAMRENAEIMYEDGYETKYEGYDPTSPESFIMFSLLQNTHIEQSLYFASLVDREISRHAKRKSRGVKQQPILVLWRTNMPGALVEIGFISHREEEKYIASEKGQNEIAEAIATAIGEYKERWEKIRNGGIDRATEAPLPEPKPAAGGSVVKPSTSNITAAGTKQPAKPQSRATYHVQIFSTSRVLNDGSPEFKGLKNVEYYRVGAACRYFVGSFGSEREAARLLREVRLKFPDAFVVKLRNGKPE